MTACTAAIHLYGRDDVCQDVAGHHGAHWTDVYGPRIHWTANNVWTTERAVS